MKCDNALTCPNVVWIDDADGVSRGFCECNRGGHVAQRPIKKSAAKRKAVKENNDNGSSIK